MNAFPSRFSICIDLLNPGHFFGCCGLLELAHRFWRGAEGWFDESTFCIRIPESSATLAGLIEALRSCEIAGLTTGERHERDALEAESRESKKRGEKLSTEKDARRVELGQLAREGKIDISSPFNLVLDWWQSDDGERAPKTWAGRQENYKVAVAAQNSLLSDSDPRNLFDHGAVLRTPEGKTVEPFYFDARRFAHPLDAGFSLDVQGSETIAHPAVELLTLIALQRFRPRPSSVKWSYEYFTWAEPLPAPVAGAVTSGAIGIYPRRLFRFPLLFRDDQKRYKAFGIATPIGGQ